MIIYLIFGIIVLKFCTRINETNHSYAQATGSRLGTVIQALSTLTLSLALALYYDWRLALLGMPFMPVVLASVFFQSKMLMGQAFSDSKSLEVAGQVGLIL